MLIPGFLLPFPRKLYMLQSNTKAGNKMWMKIRHPSQYKETFTEVTI